MLGPIAPRTIEPLYRLARLASGGQFLVFEWVFDGRSTKPAIFRNLSCNRYSSSSRNCCLVPR